MSNMVKRRSKRVWILPLGLLAATLVATGCAREQESLIVRHSPTWSDGECRIDAGNDTALLTGVLDLSQGTAYLMPLIIQNQLLSEAPDTSNNGIDNGEVQIVGADVTLRMPQAPEVLDSVAGQNGAFVEFSVDLASVSVASGQRAGITVEVISQGASDALATAIQQELPENSQPTILADVVVRASRTGNKVGAVGEIDSRTYTFPIRLCFDCLLTCSTCNDGQCPTESRGFVGGVCGNAQDALIAPGGCPNPNVQ